jgi:hypothetical protein
MEAPESGTLFVHVPLSEPMFAVVVGLPASYRVHWVPSGKSRRYRPVRCVGGDGESCVACNRGHAYNVRYLVPVRQGVADHRWLDTGRSEGRPVVLELDPIVRMLEIGRPQYYFVSVRELRRDWIGCEVHLWRKSPHKNGEIKIAKIGAQEVPDDDQLDAETAAAVEGLAQYRAWVLDRQSAVNEIGAAPLGLDGPYR